MIKLLSNFIIVLVASTIGLLLCEFGSRFILNPVDYLSPTVIRDNVLGVIIPPKSSGHDEWGFRNRKVPSSVDIVALGDSHTYGNTAKMTESWPNIVGKLTGKSVYNFGLGGYSPNQYYYLFQNKALNLKPNIIICGLYMGDDFLGALEMTYSLEYWKFLRNPSFDQKVDYRDVWEKIPDISWHKEARNWLSTHSFIYRLTVHGLFDRLKGSVQIRNASKYYESTSVLIEHENNIEEAFLPKGVKKNLDQQNPGIKEGMRITFHILKDMNDICKRNNIIFIVAVIPTKESVFSKHIENNSKMFLSDVIDSAIKNENIARKMLFEYFLKYDIRYIDLLPPMQSAVEREKIYAASAVDTHPNKNGYRVIGEYIARYISSSF